MFNLIKAFWCKRFSRSPPNGNLKRLIELTALLEERETQINVPPFIMRVVGDHLSIAMWCKDRDGIFTYVNKIGCDTILHCTEEQALALTDSDFKSDALAPICLITDNLVMENKTTLRILEHSRYPDGRDIWLDTIKSPWAVGGEIVGTTAVASVITEKIPIEVRDKLSGGGYIEIELETDVTTEKLLELIEV